MFDGAAGQSLAFWQDGSTRLSSFLEAGGPVVLVLVALSVLALGILILKTVQFALLRLGDESFLEPALRRIAGGDGAGALDLLRHARSPLARVIEPAALAEPGCPQAILREEMERTGRAALQGLRTHFRTLEVIGTLSPLLGLFGTVLGMIEAFRRLEAAGSRVDPSILSGGIWGALLTTAVGLAVAIPTIAALNWLERRVERLAHDMDDAAARVFTSRIGLERVRTPAPAAVDRPDARASAPLPGKV